MWVSVCVNIELFIMSEEYWYVFLMAISNALLFPHFRGTTTPHQKYNVFSRYSYWQIQGYYPTPSLKSVNMHWNTREIYINPYKWYENVWGPKRISILKILTSECGVVRRSRCHRYCLGNHKKFVISEKLYWNRNILLVFFFHRVSKFVCVFVLSVLSDPNSKGISFVVFIFLFLVKKVN